MAETRHTFCRICEALCGLEVDVEGDRVVDVRPDPRHVASAGFACVKGIRQAELYGSSDRLRTPLRRVGDRHVPATWDEALSAIGAEVRRLRRDHHPDSVAMYVGTAAGFSLLHPIFAYGFMAGVGSKSIYSSATQDCSNKFAVAEHLYGFPFTQPFPDVDRTGCLIIVGANPAVSKWSFLQISNPVARLKALEERGAALWIVDPRRTETARAAGRHAFIRPGTDVFFYLSFLHEILRREAVDRTVVDAHTTGFDEVAALARAWPPERAAEVTAIPADTLRAMVTDYVAADGAALYASTGVNMSGHGALAFWIQEVINAVTGNLDRAGGTLVGKGVVDFPAFASRFGMLMRRDRSRVGDFPSVNDAFPGGLLADEILTPGERQVRALFVSGGNPLLTMPNAGRLARAVDALELLVVVDVFLNETASRADWVLPATSPLQRPDLPFSFPLFFGIQSQPYVQATRAVAPPRGEQRDEATIYLDLCRHAGVGFYGSRLARGALQALRRARRLLGRGDGVPQEALLDLLLRVSGQGSLKRLLAEPHGRRLDVRRAGTYLGQRVLTDDGRLHLAPAPLMAAARDLEAAYEARRADDGLRLITKRAITSHNSWTHNLPAFTRGKRRSNHLYIHPDDADARGLSDGDPADVIAETAAVRVSIIRDDTLMRGVVALPHGWGHQRARGLSIARRTRGVNANLLAADGPDRLCRISGMATLSGIPVVVRAAEGPRDPTTWSGLPEEAPA